MRNVLSASPILNVQVSVHLLVYCACELLAALPFEQLDATDDNMNISVGRSDGGLRRSNYRLPSITFEKQKPHQHPDASPVHNAVRTKPMEAHSEKSVIKKLLHDKKESSKQDENLRFVKFDTGETIRLRCRIIKGPYLVMWNKLGLDYPLTIGTRRFSPDDRIRIQHKPPDKWVLTITDAKLTDSGVYTCTTSINNAVTQRNRKPCLTGATKKNITPDLQSLNMSDCGDEMEDAGPSHGDVSSKTGYTDYYVTVSEPDLTDRFQVDAPAKDKSMGRKQITVTGPLLVFYGTPLELMCRASFPTDEAKLNPKITLEWYHRGVRRRPHTTRSGGVYISERWIDSHILESRLLVTWASEADAGQWICLDRSTLSPSRGMLFTEQQEPRFGRGRTNEINFSPMNSYLPSVKNQLSTNEHSNNDIEFDRIDVMVIDIPDPTESRLAQTTEAIPAYQPMNDQAPRSNSENFTRALARTSFGKDASRSSRRLGNAASENPQLLIQITFLCTLLPQLVSFIFQT